MRAISCDYSYLFPGGVPGWVIFGMQAKAIERRLTDTHDDDLPEISLIGLIAYFEGFVRYHFASCANICPRLLSRFSQSRPKAVISLRDITELDTPHGSIGFILADELEFTTPKEINAHFRDLIGVSPFSKDEISTYNAILHDRHQIVHSAGMFTAKYIRNRKDHTTEGPARMYMDSLVITKDRVIEVSGFLLKITEKLVRSADLCLADPTNWHSEEEMVSMEEPRNFLKWTTKAFDPAMDEG